MTKIKPPITKRSWVSISLAITMLGLGITGVCSYLFAYSEFTAGTHTWFGLSFLVLLFWHLKNNLRGLINYLKSTFGKKMLGAASASALLILVGISLSFPPFSSLIDFGKGLRKSVTLLEGSYQTIVTQIKQDGIPINIELRKGPHYESEPQPLFLGLTYTSVPQMAYWIEDLEGNYIETLYVTKKTSAGNFVPADDIFGTTQRPEALPYWAHQRGVQYAGGLMVPSTGNTDLDGRTGATPLGNYDIKSVAPTKLKQFRVLLEINRSYDFNEFYSKDRYPDDPIYSGSGSSGQPSVIYAIDINLEKPERSFFMKPIGHGHYSGQDGVLYSDMQGIDTALELVERVVVDVKL